MVLRFNQTCDSGRPADMLVVQRAREIHDVEQLILALGRELGEGEYAGGHERTSGGTRERHGAG